MVNLTIYLPEKQRKAWIVSFFLVLFGLFLQQVVYATVLSVQLYFDSQPSLQNIEKVSEKSDTFRVKVINTARKPIQNTKVQWEVSNPNIKILSFNDLTDAQGYSTIELLIPPGSVGTLTALHNGQHTNFDFESNQEYQFLGKLEKTPEANAEANGVNAVTVTARVINPQHQNTTSGAMIHWHLENNRADAVLSADKSTSIENGKAVIKVRANQAGSVKVLATIKNSATTHTADLQREIEIVFAKNYALGLQPLQLIPTYHSSDQLFTTSVTAIVKKNAQDTLSAPPVYWRLNDSQNIQASLSTTKKRVNNKGESTIAVTSANPGTVDIFATLYNPDDPTELEQRKTTITFEPTYQLTPLTVINDNAEANGTETITVQTQLTNGQEKGLPKKTVYWRLLENSANAYLVNTTTTTTLKGETKAVIKASQAGSVTIEAMLAKTLSQPAITQTKTVSFVKSYNVGFKSLLLDKSIAKGNGLDLIIATATTVGGNGQGSKNKRKVYWSLEDNAIGAKLSTPDSTTDDQGRAIASISALMEGEVTVAATVTHPDNPSKKETLYTKAYFKNQAGIDTLTSTPSVVGNRDNHITLTASVINEMQHPLKGQAIAWSIEDNDNIAAQFIELAENKINKSDDTGKAKVKIRAARGGTVNVIATVVNQLNGNSSLVQQKSIPVTFKKAPLKMTLKPDKEKPVEANGEDHIVVTATLISEDEESLIGKKIKWVLLQDKSNAQPIKPLQDSITTTDTQGKTSITLKATKPGQAKVTAHVMNDSNNLYNKRVSAQTDIRFIKSFGCQETLNGCLNIEVSRNNALVGEAVNVTVTALAANNQPIKDLEIQLTSSGVGSTPQSTLVTDRFGIATATYHSTIAGLLQVTATPKGLDSNEIKAKTTQLVEFQHYDLKSITPEQNSFNLVAGANTATITLKLESISQHSLTTFPVKNKAMQIQWQNQTIDSVPSIQFENHLSNDQGEITFTVSSRSPLSNTLFISSHETQASIKGQNKSSYTKTFNFTAKQDVAKIDFTIDNDTVSTQYRRIADNQEKVKITLKATTSKDLAVTNGPVKWTTKGVNLGHYQTSGETTDENGEAWIEVASNNSAGFLEVSATVAGEYSDVEKEEDVKQRIEFQKFHIVLDKKIIASPINLIHTLTGSIQTISNDPNSKTPARFVKNKPFSITQSDQDTNQVNITGRRMSDAQGKINLKLAGAIVSKNSIILSLDGLGVSKDKKETTAQFQLYKPSDFTIFTLTTHASKTLEARNGANPHQLTAYVRQKNDTLVVPSDVKHDYHIDWKLEHNKVSIQPTITSKTSLEVSGYSQNTLASRRKVDISITASLKYKNKVISTKTLDVNFSQTPVRMRIDPSHSFKECSIIHIEESPNVLLDQLPIQVIDASNEPVSGISVKYSVLLRSRMTFPWQNTNPRKYPAEHFTNSEGKATIDVNKPYTSYFKLAILAEANIPKNKFLRKIINFPFFKHDTHNYCIDNAWPESWEHKK